MNEIIKAVIAQITQESRRLIDTKTKTHEQILADPTSRTRKSLSKIP